MAGNGSIDLICLTTWATAKLFFDCSLPLFYERQGEPLNVLARFAQSSNCVTVQHRRFSAVPRVGFAIAFVVALFSMSPGAHSAPLSTSLSSTRLAQVSDSNGSDSNGVDNNLALPPVNRNLPTATTLAPDAQLVALSDILVSNAAPQQLNDARLQLAKTARLLAAHDANTLQIFGLQDTRAIAVGVAPAKKKGKVNRALPISDASSLPLKMTLSRLAVSPNGTLMRVTMEALPPKNDALVAVSSNAVNAAPQPFVNQALFTGARTYDLWYAPQPDGSLALQAWPVARDAADVMSDEAERHWQNSADVDSASLDNSGAHGSAHSASVADMDAASTVAESSVPLATTREGDILDLVAEYRGGQWLPLRASAPWRGALLDDGALAQAAARMKTLQTQASNAATADSGNASNAAPLSSTRTVVEAQTAPSAASDGSSVSAVTPLTPTAALAKNNANSGAALRNVRFWLVAQMSRYRRRAAGTAHFLFQRGLTGWIGIDSVFEAAKGASDLSYAADENAVRSFRAQMQGEGYLSATSHRDFALLLARVHLLNEAADQLAQARLMQPDLVSDKQTQTFERNRVLDPQIQAQSQRDALKRVGFSPEHPILRIPYLLSQFRRQPSPLTALRLGLEYSRLGYEREAAASLTYGEANATQFLALTTTNDIDRAWFGVLRDQLRNRLALAPSKPPNTVRSDLFTVRCSLNDPNAPQLLAGLEAAQYKIYSSFGVPMGNTEVILWSSQNQFQAYTTRQAGRNTSEFVTALTITQLVNADVGPVVLGEEINFFADPRADSISTIAHEYGHIAVRALAKGRAVPDWLNEGIATYTEGGYDNYIKRVRAGKAAGTLLSMPELQAWNVDGERAFLAYSQANSMVDFIVARWGNTAVLDILGQIGKDIPPDVALRQTLRVTPEAFYQLWLQNGIK